MRKQISFENDKRSVIAESAPTDVNADTNLPDASVTNTDETAVSDAPAPVQASSDEPVTKKKMASTFIFAFVLTVFLMLGAAFLILNAVGFSLLNVETGSMEPNLPVGSLIFVKSVPPEEIKSGDVITFALNEDGVLATHRVKFVRSNSRTFITRGDANNTDDPPVSWDQLVGKVITHVPGIGFAFQFMTSPDNRVVIIIILAVMVVLAFSWDFIMTRVFKRKKKQAEVSSDPDGAVSETQTAPLKAEAEDDVITKDAAPPQE